MNELRKNITCKSKFVIYSNKCISIKQITDTFAKTDLLYSEKQTLSHIAS